MNVRNLSVIEFQGTEERTSLSVVVIGVQAIDKRDPVILYDGAERHCTRSLVHELSKDIRHFRSVGNCRSPKLFSKTIRITARTPQRIRSNWRRGEF